MRLFLLVTFFIHLVQSAYFQSYNGDINPNACLNPSDTSTITTIDFVAPDINVTGNVGIRQIAFQWYGYTYNEPTVTMNGVTDTIYGNCCTLAGCDAPTYYIPWNENECGLTWCGTLNQWQYIDYTGTTLHTIGVQSGEPLTVEFPNPLNMILNDNNYPIFTLSYDIVIPPSSSPTTSPSVSLTPSETSSISLSLIHI